jgi:hypothetical protein
MKFLLFNIAVIAALAYLFIQPSAKETDELTTTASAAVAAAKARIQDLVSELRGEPQRDEVTVAKDTAPAETPLPSQPSADTVKRESEAAVKTSPVGTEERTPPLPPRHAAPPSPTTPLTPLPTVDVARVEAKPPRAVSDSDLGMPRRPLRQVPARSQSSPRIADDPTPERTEAVFMSRRERARELNRLARDMEAMFIKRLPE